MTKKMECTAPAEYNCNGIKCDACDYKPICEATQENQSGSFSDSPAETLLIGEDICDLT